MFFQMCQATGGTLLFDLDLYRELSPGARRLFLKLKDRFWRSKRVFMNVHDLTINGLGFSADRPLKKRKFDLTSCIRELLDRKVIELGRDSPIPKTSFSGEERDCTSFSSLKARTSASRIRNAPYRRSRRFLRTRCTSHSTQLVLMKRGYGDCSSSIRGG